MEWLAEYGYIGLFIGAFLAATLVPFSSDVLFIGLLSAGGDPYLSIASATAGNWLGGLTSYGVGRLGRWDWLEKWFGVTREKLEKQKAKVCRYGSTLALFTWLPFVGDVMAVGLGFYRVAFINTALFMLIGKGARFILWAVIFFWVKPWLFGG